MHESATPVPRIGVTTADDPSPDNYVAAVRRYGGEPIILADTAAMAAELLANLDGLVVTGGSDIDPGRYGAAPHAATKPGDPTRDAFELAIIRAAFEAGVPTLAVCRGMQIANVAWGGTLHQHIPDIVYGAVMHDDPTRKFAAFPEHVVHVEEDSLLRRLVGTGRFATNASHHQSVARVGHGLRAVAWTDDEIVEALERPSAAAFWLATQWHPERLLDSDEGRSEAIFDAFIAAARASAALKKLPA